MHESGGPGRIALSAFLLIASLALAAFAVAPGVDPTMLARDIAGPQTWPRAMLLGVALCAAILLVGEGRAFLAARAGAQRVRSTAPAAPEAAADCMPGDGEPAPASSRTPASEPGYGRTDNLRATLAIVILVLYGVALPLLGFAFATALFLVVCLGLGGIRKAHVVASVSVIGTVVLLYIFVKVSVMPLERGVPPFGDLTIAVYRLLGIY